jgi:D-ribose pyranase
MKKSGILHGELAGHLARLGHTDTFLVVDSGFPVPPDVPVVDLRVVFGLPPFEPVLRAVLAEVVVEHAVAASELPAANPAIHAVMTGVAGDVELVPHVELKRRAVGARFAVRTAEDTPYGNILLTAGVAFDV